MTVKSELALWMAAALNPQTGQLHGDEALEYLSFSGATR